MLRSRVFLLAIIFGFIALIGAGAPAEAHGFTTAVYVDATSPHADRIEMDLGLEFDLLLVSVADTQHDDPFYREGQPAWDDADFTTMTRALADHRASVQKYIAERLTVTYAGAPCAARLGDDVSVAMNQEQQVPYANVVVDYTCPADADAEVLGKGHVISSTLFGDDEGYVKDAKTIVTYDLDDRAGSAALDSGSPSFSTKQSWQERFWEFWKLGGEHLLRGWDHMLFLTALIIGSRRLREVVLAATTFTLAHTTTLILAAFGVVHGSADVIEAIIALSISATAGWYLWRVWRRGEHAADLEVAGRSHFALDRAGWSRLAIVFLFGLVHGMGFAGALGIDHAWSWQLLWSLVVFNVGIESVQIGLIIVIFPVLMVLRHRAPRTALWISAAITLAVAVIGLIWFGQRVFGFELLGEGG